MTNTADDPSVNRSAAIAVFSYISPSAANGCSKCVCVSGVGVQYVLRYHKLTKMTNPGSPWYRHASRNAWMNTLMHRKRYTRNTTPPVALTAMVTNSVLGTNSKCVSVCICVN